jgi:MFS family permease
MFSRIVVLLSLVSLINDVASEMIIPALPVYLHSLGYSAMALGFIEAIAEAVTGSSKAYLGARSDALGKRLPFVRIGYALSAVAKPLLGIVSSAAGIVGARALDRVGKGVRTAPRDAMLAEAATPETRARVFGLHRAMDTTGAVIGPLLALAFLAAFPTAYRTLFLLTAIPGALVVVCVMLLREGEGRQGVPAPKLRAAWRTLSADVRLFIGRMAVFYAFNSADTFLLLRTKEAGATDITVISVYVLYNIVYATSSLPLGSAADRWGTRRVIIGGLCVFAIVYMGFAFTTSIVAYTVLFGVYGLYAAATDGVAKAHISTICHPDRRGLALGTHASVQSVALVCASLLAGALWASLGPSVALSISAGAAILAAVLLL